MSNSQILDNMEKESTSTWALLNKSGEIVHETDPGSSSESSIEFIQDEVVHDERNNIQQSSLQQTMQKDNQDEAESSSKNLIKDGMVSIEAENVSSVKDDEEVGEGNRNEFMLENIVSTNIDATSISPSSTSPISPTSSDDSSGSITLLDGRLSDGDLDTFPEDFWFDSDFELLDQHSNSDLAHLQLAAGVNSASSATHRPKFNFKLKKQALVTTNQAESVNASDADDEGCNNVELCSSSADEELEITYPAPIENISTIQMLCNLAPMPPQLPVSSLTLKPPRTPVILACLGMILLIGFSTKYCMDSLSNDFAEMEHIAQMHSLKKENEHMRNYVDSLKWRMNSLQDSNKKQLSEELRHVNQLLKGRIDELDQQIHAVRQEILEAKSGVQASTVSDSGNKVFSTADIHKNLKGSSSNADVADLKGSSLNDDTDNTDLKRSSLNTDADAPQDLEKLSSNKNADVHHDLKKSTLDNNNDYLLNLMEPSGDNKLKTQDKSNNLFIPLSSSHDDDIQIHPASKNDPSLIPNRDNANKVQSSDSSHFDNHERNGRITSDQIITSENEGEDAVFILQMKLEEEKRRADNFEKLYTELKQTLINSQKLPSIKSPVLDAGPSMVKNDQGKKEKESSHCLPFDEECHTNMDWLNRDAMLHLVGSVISEMPPQAQQWKEYVTKKLKSVFETQTNEKEEKVAVAEEVKAEVENNSNFEFKKLNVYMKRMFNQMNKAREDLKKQFEKTLLKLKKGTSKFWQKNVLKAKKTKDLELMYDDDNSNGDSKIKLKNTEDSNLELIEENNSLDPIDGKKGQRKVKMNASKPKGHGDKIKFSISEHDKKYKHDRSKDSKKFLLPKSSFKPREQPTIMKDQHKFSKKERLQKGDKKEKKYRSYKLNHGGKKPQYNHDEDEVKENKPDNKKKTPFQKHGSAKLKINGKEELKSEKKGKRYVELSAESKKPVRIKDHHESNDEGELHHRFQHSDDDRIVYPTKISNMKSDSHQRKKQKEVKKYRNEKKIIKKSGEEEEGDDDDDNDDDKKNKQEQIVHATQKVPSKYECHQLASELEDFIHTISEQKFRYTNLDRILQISEMISNFNAQCKQLSSKSLKDWSACQQMWWTLCGEGFLQSQLKNSNCEQYLLDWQISMASSLDGSEKPDCDDCGCRRKPANLKMNKKKQENDTNSDSVIGKKVISGEWYFKPKSVPGENMERGDDKDERWKKKVKTGEWYFKHKSVPDENMEEEDDEEERWKKKVKTGEWYFKSKSVPDENMEEEMNDKDERWKKKVKTGEWYFKSKSVPDENMEEEMNDEEERWKKKVKTGEWYFKSKSVPDENMEEEMNDEEERWKKKVKTGEWYFKRKSVPVDNNNHDCDENDFECLSSEFWDELETDKMQYPNQILNAVFHQLNHYNHVHQKRCRDNNNNNNNNNNNDYNCYSWFHPMNRGKWVSVFYQNLLNFIQNWKK